MTCRVLVTLCLLFSCMSPVLAQLPWSDPIFISSGSNPDLDMDKQTGRLHIVTVKTGVGVTYTEADSLGNILGQETVPGSRGDYDGLHFGPAVVVDGQKTVHICFRKNMGDWFYELYYISKTGDGWSDSIKLNSGKQRGYVVKMAVDNLNRVHIVQSSASSVYGEPWGDVTYYQVQNNSLIKSVMVTNPNQKNYRVDNRFEIDCRKTAYLHLVVGCPDPSQGPIFYYRSFDGGTTWIAMGDIHSTQCPGRNGSPDVAADTVGNVHICYGTEIDAAVNNKPSVRYVRYESNTIVRQITVTTLNELGFWKEENGWGLGSVAASNSGKYVMIAYLTADEGTLYTRFSSNNGVSWSDRTWIADEVGGSLGRENHLIRAYRNHFYLIYPGQYTYLRVLRDVGDNAPTAVSGGPYSGVEGSPITLDMSPSSDTGENSGIVEYAWDWENDGVFDMSAAENQAEATFNDDFAGTAVLRVIDRAGKTDFDTTTITVTNLNPNVSLGGPLTGSENNVFAFSCTVSDPGSGDTLAVTWDFRDGSSVEGNPVGHIYRNDGVYWAIVTVADDDGGTDRDSLRVTVQNLPPVAEAGGPYLANVGVPITFAGSALDPGPDDTLTYSWDLDGDLIFETPGQTVVRSYPSLGSLYVRIQVDDGDGGIDFDSTTVVIANEAPMVGSIPDQSVEEGGTFAPIVLDNFVSDPDNSDPDMIWTVHGYHDLLVTLADRILTVAVPDSEWSGQETVSLVVTDPVGFRDSTVVTFFVLAVNDPPSWSRITDIAFNEDDTVSVLFSTLRTLASDVDDVSGSLSFEISDNIHVLWQGLSDRINLTAGPDWNGHETITWVVNDPHGASGSKTSLVTVNPMPDIPHRFSLSSPMNENWDAWPDTVVFVWRQSLDPDSGDAVYYTWNLNGQEGEALSHYRTRTLRDTVNAFLPDEELASGIYFWWVVAADRTGRVRESDNNGVLVVGTSAVPDSPAVSLPSAFELLQNYPNPFNPSTRIAYRLPVSSEVCLAVYDMRGREIKILEQGTRPPGEHIVVWDGTGSYGERMPSGIYVVRMAAGSQVFVRKLLFVQ